MSRRACTVIGAVGTSLFWLVWTIRATYWAICLWLEGTDPDLWMMSLLVSCLWLIPFVVLWAYGSCEEPTASYENDA